MQVIAGEFRSRKIISLEGTDVRPTPGRLRETLFNILQDEIRDAAFIDAYAGTGSVGIEALSRGARHVVFLEKDRDVVEIIKQNLAALKIGSRARIIKGHAANLLATLKADIVFADPPYPKEKEYQAVVDVFRNAAVREKDTLLILQHAKRFTPPPEFFRQLQQGDNALTFYRIECTTR